MTFSAAQIAALINGKIEGDANISVNSFGKIEEAEEGQLAFLPILNTKNIYTAPKLLLLLSMIALELKQPVTATLIRVPDAYTAFATLLANTRK